MRMIWRANAAMLAVLAAGLPAAGCGGDSTGNQFAAVVVDPSIATVAGDGTDGFSGDAGAAAAAQLDSPQDVALDAAGNLFIADVNNNRIRRVDALTGVITTVAGDGTAAFGGDGAAATAAQLNAPRGVALDAAGNLFIADTDNQRIRRVDVLTGVIVTVAGDGTAAFFGDGGAATAARLQGPQDVALDAAGNLFIADSVNDRIRRVDALTGVITTVAGDGTIPATFGGDGGDATAAQLDNPLDVALDAAGNLFIADTVNNRIRRVDAQTGVIETVAGDGTGAFGGDGAAATAAQLFLPAGMALDAAGNLFFADIVNQRIRRVDALTGVIETVAGDGAAGFSGDGGDPTLTQLNNPTGVALDAAGNLFIAGSNNHRIRRVNNLSSLDIVTTTLAFAPRDAFYRQTVFATGGSGSDYDWSVSSGALPGGMVLIDGTPAAILSGTPTVAGVFGFILEVTDSDGSSDTGLLQIVVADPVITTVAGDGTGAFGGDTGAATAAQLSSSLDVALDSAGNMFISDFSNNRIRRVDAQTGVITTVAGDGTAGSGGDGGVATAAQLDGALGVAVDAVGNVFIADTNNHRIRRVDAQTGVITTVAGDGTNAFGGDTGAATAAQLDQPQGVALDVAGNLFIADTNNHRIRRVDAQTGVITTVAGDGTNAFGGDAGVATAARMDRPQDVTLDAAGNLFIADFNNHRIRRVDAQTGVITTVAGDGTNAFGGDSGAATAAQLSFPGDVAVDAAGNLFIADLGNHRIRRVDAQTGVIETLAGDGTAAFAGDVGAAAAAQLNFPSGVEVDAAGNILIADRFNNRIRRVGPP